MNLTFSHGVRFLGARSVLAVFASLHAGAHQPAGKLALAEQLVQQLQINDSFAIYLTECSKVEGSTFDPKMQFRSDPSGFGGVSPKSSYWPEIEAIYARFQKTTCAYSTPEKFTRFYVEQFAERLSEDDMRASIEFNSSAVGKRLQAAQLSTESAFQPFASKLMSEAYAIAQAQFRQEVQALLEKYKENPQ